MPQETILNYIAAAAALREIAIEEDCLPGIAANLSLLLHHCAIVSSEDAKSLEPAELLRP